MPVTINGINYEVYCDARENLDLDICAIDIKTKSIFDTFNKYHKLNSAVMVSVLNEIKAARKNSACTESEIRYLNEVEYRINALLM